MKQKFKLVQVEVARASDFGVNNRTFIINTHLGEYLNYNDTVLGFDLEGLAMIELEDFERNSSRQFPPVVLVKKTYPKHRNRQKNRIWKLKNLNKVEIDENNMWAGKNVSKNKNRKEVVDQDMQIFMQDVEEEPELRNQINLYRDDDVIAQLERKIAGLDLDKEMEAEEGPTKGIIKVGSSERKVA